MKKQHKIPPREYADRSTLTTWMVSYEQVQSQSKETAGLLKLWGFLDCKDMWYELIASALHLDDTMETPGWLLRLAKDQLEFSAALQLLSQYSLIDAREETLSHSMHSVLHEWCFQLAEDGERKTLCWLAAGLVAQMVRGESEPEYWKLQRRLLLHGSRVYQVVNNARSKQSTGNSGWALPPWISFDLGMLFARQDKLDKAEKTYLSALEESKKAICLDHESVLRTVGNMGILYKAQGRLAEAEEVYTRVLKVTEKVLGSEHESIFNTLNNLGNLYAEEGKLAEAERMYIRALEGKEKAFGSGHISTLDTNQNLASLYVKQRKLADAEKMYMRLLIKYEEVFGSEHISILSVVQNLGSLYRYQGNLEEAEKMYRRALEGYENAFGPEHTTTLDTKFNLGLLYADQGRLADTEEEWTQVLKGYQTFLESSHPKYQYASRALAALQRSKKD